MEALTTRTHTHANSHVERSYHEKVPLLSRTPSCSCRTAAPSTAPYETRTAKGILALFSAELAGLHPEMVEGAGVVRVTSVGNGWADSTQGGVDTEGKAGYSNHAYSWSCNRGCLVIRHGYRDVNRPSRVVLDPYFHVPPPLILVQYNGTVHTWYGEPAGVKCTLTPVEPNPVGGTAHAVAWCDH